MLTVSVPFCMSITSSRLFVSRLFWFVPLMDWRHDVMCELCIKIVIVLRLRLAIILESELAFVNIIDFCALCISYSIMDIFAVA